MWRRAKTRKAEQPAQAAHPADKNRQPIISLRPMTETEYARFRGFLDEDYAQDISRAMRMPIEEARVAADKQMAELLKDGLHTEGHYLWKIVAQDSAAVGDLWVLVDASKQRAFIYFVGIDEPQRGKGYGKAVMRALEGQVKPMGVDRIELNVFGDNTTAIHLYESLGYRPIAIGMRKEI
jgi:ribosomal protein S18 acetylase RimI-like enzyme